MDILVFSPIAFPAHPTILSPYTLSVHLSIILSLYTFHIQFPVHVSHILPSYTSSYFFLISCMPFLMQGVCRNEPPGKFLIHKIGLTNGKRSISQYFLFVHNFVADRIFSSSKGASGRPPTLNGIEQSINVEVFWVADSEYCIRFLM